MKKSKHISLSITERCNLNCIYCFEKSKSPQKMTFETAVEKIDFELIHSEEYKSVAVDFMGGEPFLEFDLIKKICEYYWSKQNDLPKPLTFFTTTNGTLVHGRIKEWLAEHSDRFVCALSLDGIPLAHDINRSNSFSRIDVSFFREMWPKQKVKSLVSAETLQFLADSVIYMHNLGFPQIEIKLAYGFDWTDISQGTLFMSELDKLKAFYLQHSEVNPCSFLNINVKEVLEPGTYIKKWCQAGERTISYDMDGNRYPCRYFQDLRKSGKLSLEDIWMVDYGKIQYELSGSCRTCLIRNLCRTCYALNYDVNGSFGVKTHMSCRVTQIMAYKTAQLISDRESKADDDTLRACQLIIEAFEKQGFQLRGI